MKEFHVSAGEIRWRVHFHSPPVDVYQFLATDTGRKKFWAESTLESGESITFHFSGFPPVECRVLTREPSYRFALEYFGAFVEFNLLDDGAGGTDLELVSTKVPEHEYVEVRAGWVSVLMAMKAAVDFGVDLRNHDAERTWAAGYANN